MAARPVPARGALPPRAGGPVPAVARGQQPPPPPAGRGQQPPPPPTSRDQQPPPPPAGRGAPPPATVVSPAQPARGLHPPHAPTPATVVPPTPPPTGPRPLRAPTPPAVAPPQRPVPGPRPSIQPPGNVVPNTQPASTPGGHGTQPSATTAPQNPPVRPPRPDRVPAPPTGAPPQRVVPGRRPLPQPPVNVPNHPRPLSPPEGHGSSPPAATISPNPPVRPARLDRMPAPPPGAPPQRPVPSPRPPTQPTDNLPNHSPVLPDVPAHTTIPVAPPPPAGRPRAPGLPPPPRQQGTWNQGNSPNAIDPNNLDYYLPKMKLGMGKWASIDSGRFSQPTAEELLSGALDSRLKSDPNVILGHLKCPQWPYPHLEAVDGGKYGQFALVFSEDAIQVSGNITFKTGRDDVQSALLVTGSTWNRQRCLPWSSQRVSRAVIEQGTVAVNGWYAALVAFSAAKGKNIGDRTWRLYHFDIPGAEPCGPQKLPEVKPVVRRHSYDQDPNDNSAGRAAEHQYAAAGDLVRDKPLAESEYAFGDRVTGRRPPTG